MRSFSTFSRFVWAESGSGLGVEWWGGDGGDVLGGVNMDEIDGLPGGMVLLS